MKGYMIALLGGLILSFWAVGCAPSVTEGIPERSGEREGQVEVFRRSQPMMGTGFEIQVVTREGAKATEAINAAYAEIARVEALLSEWRDDSEISELNRRGHVGAVAVGPELFEVIERGISIGELSGGAFDITFAGCAGLWSQANEKLPSEEAIQSCLPKVGYQSVVLDKGRREIRFAREGMKVGIGGIGKGYGVDRAAAVLVERGFTDFVVDGGGDLYVSGTNRGAPWAVGVMNPREREELLGIVKIERGAVATSGDYERFFMHEGKRYHHIMDPRTGWPAGESMAVTVVANNATQADALATTLFVLGPEEGLELVGRLEGVEALIIGTDETLHLSAGMGSYFWPVGGAKAMVSEAE